MQSSKYEEKMQLEANSISTKFGLNIPLRKTGNNLYFDFVGQFTKISVSTSVKELEEWFRLDVKERQSKKLGQLTIRVDNYKLKQTLIFEQNQNNTGKYPWNLTWDSSPAPELQPGSFVSIGACEYGVGDGGEFRYDSWRKSMTQQEATLVLEIGRRMFYSNLIK